MDKFEILSIVSKAIDQSLAGLELENSKFDFKLKWYKLSEEPGRNEFVKDTTAIANSFGPDGFLVIGYNDKTKDFHSSPFVDSGLRDTSDLMGIINSKVDRMFNCDLYQMQYKDNIISIIHIPPSIDKPHVIRKYLKFKRDGEVPKETDGAIFIRTGTRTVTAGKNDLELMYYDRKNVMPEYRVLSSCYYKSILLNYDWDILNKDYILFCNIPLTIENTGSRPVSICRFKIKLVIPIFSGTVEQGFNSDNLYLSQTIILQPGEIKNCEIKFNSRTSSGLRAHEETQIIDLILKNRKDLENNPIELTLSNGTKLVSDLTILKE